VVQLLRKSGCRIIIRTSEAILTPSTHVIHQIFLAGSHQRATRTIWF